MKYVYEHQEEAREKGKRAAADMRAHCSPEVVGAFMERRLLQIVNAPR